MKGFTRPSCSLAAALCAGLLVWCGLAGAAQAVSVKGGVKVDAAGGAAAAVPSVTISRADIKPGALDVVPVPAAQIEAQVLELARQVAERLARAGSTGPVVSRIEVSLGAVDSRLRLAPCDKLQAYVPDGSNLWGRTRVGLRCEQGAVRWNVFMPVTVHAFGSGVVPAVNLSFGTRIEAADLRMAEVDLAADSSAAIVSVEDAVGRLVARNVLSGQSLRQAHLKPKRYFSVGDPVRLVVKGPGFAVNGEGEALTPGDEGQCSRIRTEAGRIVCARPVGDRVAELLL